MQYAQKNTYVFKNNYKKYFLKINFRVQYFWNVDHARAFFKTNPTIKRSHANIFFPMGPNLEYYIWLGF